MLNTALEDRVGSPGFIADISSARRLIASLLMNTGLVHTKQKIRVHANLVCKRYKYSSRVCTNLYSTVFKWYMQSKKICSKAETFGGSNYQAGTITRQCGMWWEDAQLPRSRSMMIMVMMMNVMMLMVMNIILMVHLPLYILHIFGDYNCTRNL